MTPLLVRLLSAALLATCLPGSAALALTLEDREAVREIISLQIDAFRQDDAPAAYGFAAPNIRQMFPTAERFMDMVRTRYRAVYRPQSVTFGEIFETEGGVLQKVYLTGPNRGNWLAAYVAERQPDGSWKISGCALVVDGSQGI